MHIKIQLMLLKNRIKQNLFDLGMNILKRIDAEQLKKANIGINMSISVRKIVPKDGMWHHFAMTTDCWIKRTKNKTQKKQKDNYFLDGVKVKPKKSTRRTK
jgi:hypothetical protein